MSAEVPAMASELLRSEVAQEAETAAHRLTLRLAAGINDGPLAVGALDLTVLLAHRALLAGFARVASEIRSESVVKAEALVEAADEVADGELSTWLFDRAVALLANEAGDR